MASHTINDHLTPELMALLEDKREETKDARTNKIIAHIAENSDDPQIIYAAGIGHYFLGEYEECMKLEEDIYHCFDDEMGIACIFWHTLAAWRCGKRASLLEDKYHKAMLVGHHKSYNRIMALASGVLSLKNALLMFSTEFRPLEYSIFGYGLSCYLEFIGEKDQAEEVLEKVYANDDFWISYAYLAARCDMKREGLA